MRNNNKERIGLYKIALLTEGELGWIFREQPIVDVGIDGTIEQSSDGNPDGKFLGIQSKCGPSHFHITKNHLTYYMTNVHYQYWMSVEFPVLLLGYLPEDDKVYWQEINKKNVKKTSKQWKLKIPKSQIFNASAKLEINHLFSTKTASEIMSSLYSVEDSRPVEFQQIIISLKKISNLLTEFVGVKNKGSNDFLSQNLLNPEQRILAFETNLSRYMMLASKRLESELLLFSEIFISELRAFERSVRFTLSVEHFEVLIDKVLRERIRISSESIKYCVRVVQEMRIAVHDFKSETEVLNNAKSDAISTLRNLELELIDADLIINKLGKLEANRIKVN